MTTVASAGSPATERSARSRLPALGALVAQVAQALANFVVQVVAARELGASGVGTFALLFGTIVMVTAVSSGLVGDSLTVLDRHEQAVRSALWRITWTLVAAAAVLALLVGCSVLSVPAGVLFATSVATYVVADLARRVLMARLEFWLLVVTDGAALLVTAGVLVAGSVTGDLRLEHFLAALTAGQLTAAVVATRLLPPHERLRPPSGWGDWRAVLGYGSWRAVQQFVRPTTLNAARWLVLVAAGTAAVGVLEVTRVLVAPAMLLVQGVGSYLFASYASDRDRPTAQLRARADRAAAVMLVGAAAVGAVVAVSLPLLEDLVTDGSFELSVVAVLGWSCYAASCAAVMPYGSLAAVRGRQAAVLLVRLVDSVLSLLLVAVLLLGLGVDAQVTPWLLSAGAFFGGLLCRQVLLSGSTRHVGTAAP
ncbi:hypothetical protein GCM10023339_09370 [Alloalcanivorax gelatiniphagus]